jgi:hypothetical protein
VTKISLWQRSAVRNGRYVVRGTSSLYTHAYLPIQTEEDKPSRQPRAHPKAKACESLFHPRVSRSFCPCHKGTRRRGETKERASNREIHQSGGSGSGSPTSRFSGSYGTDGIAQERADKLDLEEIIFLDEEEDSDAEKAKSTRKKPSPKFQSVTEKASSMVQAAAEDADGDVVPGPDDNHTTGAERMIMNRRQQKSRLHVAGKAAISNNRSRRTAKSAAEVKADEKEEDELDDELEND